MIQIMMNKLPLSGFCYDGTGFSSAHSVDSVTRKGISFCENEKIAMSPKGSCERFPDLSMEEFLEKLKESFPNRTFGVVAIVG